MRKLVALLLALALVIGLVPAAMAKSYTLDIYWIANVNNDVPKPKVLPRASKTRSTLIWPSCIRIRRSRRSR